MGRSSHFTHSSVFSFSPPAEVGPLCGLFSFSGLKSQLVLSAANLRVIQLTPVMCLSEPSGSHGEPGRWGRQLLRVTAL